ncbi:PadR family transcriptional regulator [Nocardioides marmoriginsengisoli]|uniref:PadR family transcriptional regulator n=1 Tax=Nocardioides marmoriginsengisoli TaxID=661483 RepID=A0A3N0CCD4_9ACTN|nr:PadR family transcriptional regulator [Nocardioides marmoriginsengisoli]RNL60643.1 PadR family transcriptional regulator [Nocardioides marmoriginsengisoli]
MALEHALLVALSERPAAGLELARRFDRSIGFFWSATHQQIYKVLRRMETDGWVTAETIEQTGRPEKREYTVTDLGHKVLAEWISTTTPRAGFRSEIAVKMRAASYGDRKALLANIAELIADHQVRQEHYEAMAARDYPDPGVLSGQDLDTYLVLRGGILQETFWIAWLNEYLEAHA